MGQIYYFFYYCKTETKADTDSYRCGSPGTTCIDIHVFDILFLFDKSSFSVMIQSIQNQTF